MTPYEIMAGPLTLFLAPVGTAFPVIGAAPAASWIKVGTNGDRNYSEDGIVVQHNQTFGEARPAGALGAVKVWRMTEDQIVTVTLWDMTLEQYTYALSGAAPTTVAAGAGTPGYKSTGLSRGKDVATFALLARGPSPYGDAFMSQFEIPVCYQSGNPQPAFRKAVPAGLAMQFSALEHAAAANERERFGRVLMQTAAPV